MDTMFVILIHQGVGRLYCREGVDGQNCKMMWGKNLKEEIRSVDGAQLLDRCGVRALLLLKEKASWMGKTVGYSYIPGGSCSCSAGY